MLFGTHLRQIEMNLVNPCTAATPGKLLVLFPESAEARGDGWCRWIPPIRADSKRARQVTSPGVSHRLSCSPFLFL